MKNISKERFLEAFRELLQKKHFSNITVRDLTAAAGLSRQTFYRNFQDVYDLLFYMYNSDMQPFYDQNSLTDIVALSSFVAKYFKDNQHIYRDVGNDLQNPNPFLRQWLQLNYEYFEKVVGKSAINLERMIAITIFIYGSYGVDYEYMVSHLSGTPKEIGEMVARSMPEVLKPFFYFRE